MNPFLLELAEAVDQWVATHKAVITETSSAVTVGNLSADHALFVMKSGERANWAFEVSDGTESLVDEEPLHEDLAPYRIVLHKPAQTAGREFVLTNTAFRDWLSRLPRCSVLLVGRLQHAFDCHSMRFAPADDTANFMPDLRPISADKLVRQSSGGPWVPDDLGPWLLRNGQAVQWNDDAARVWVENSARAIYTSLASETEADDTLVFKGPPVARYQLGRPAVADITEGGFRQLQAAATWVFEFEREAESRHVLLAAEFGRTNVGCTAASDLFERGVGPALEGAKIAHQLGLQKLSADTLKALGDLRKAVSEESSKLADTTRQLAASVASALFAGTAVVATRLNLSVSGTSVTVVTLALGVILSAFVGAVIVSGWQFIRIQRGLRHEWRGRLYRFLPEAEYDSMVQIPAASAERAFRWASWIGGSLAAFMCIVIFFVALARSAPGDARVAGTAAPQASPPAVVPPKATSD